jgi:hypothetical protein
MCQSRRRLACPLGVHYLDSPVCARPALLSLRQVRGGQARSVLSAHGTAPEPGYGGAVPVGAAHTPMAKDAGGRQSMSPWLLLEPPSSPGSTC